MLLFIVTNFCRSSTSVGDKIRRQYNYIAKQYKFEHNSLLAWRYR